jgi:serine/threonine protein kinase
MAAISTVSDCSLGSYKTMALQYNTATDDEIVQHCRRSNPNRDIVSEFEGGRSVIRISEEAVVKCGFGVTQLEAQNQQKAYKLINPSVIRIPQVYRFFSNGDIGYIVMEYISGEELSTVADSDIFLKPMVKVLKSFEQVQHHKPGPFHGGLAIGQLWLDESIIPTTVSDIEEYYNTRQLRQRSKLNLQNYPLIFCHLDIAPRNILVLKDRSLCLIDWASAGFYPRLFERCALKINIRSENSWNAKLLNLLDIPDEDEMSQVQLLEQAYYLGVRYS